MGGPEFFGVVKGGTSLRKGGPVFFCLGQEGGQNFLPRVKEGPEKN